MYHLENKTILVTGANGLIGKAICNDLNHQGAKVVQADIAFDKGDGADKLHLDVTDNGSVDNLITYIKNNSQELDGLVNTAYPRTKDWGTPFEDIQPASWAKNVDRQLNSIFYICQQTLKLMQPHNKGSIVNIGSIYGVVGNDFTLYEDTGISVPAAYSAIKGGIVNLTRYLASYYGKHNIRINCVSPGGVFDNQEPAFVTNYCNKVPMKRMATPEDIAPAVSFLLSDGAAYITGQNLIVDGGWTAI